MSDWYARRQARQQPGPSRPSPGVPAGYQQQPMYPQQQQPQPQQFIRFQPQGVQVTNEPVTTENLWEKMKLWHGGKAHRIDAEPCPQCGGNQYYSRTGAEIRRGPPPAPHCFNCGYNGMFEQGMASTWQSPS